MPSSPNLLFVSDSQLSAQNSISPAIEMIKFRQIQSLGFQSLFGSDRASLSAPWQTRIQILHQLSNWVSSLPESTPDALKQLLLSEMFYMNILLVRPPGGNAELGHYGTHLLFEYCIGFVRNTWAICVTNWELGYFSNLELIRTDFVARVTLEVVLDSRHSFFEPIEAKATGSEGTDTLPPLNRSGPLEKIAQAINTITQLDEIFDTLAQKFGRTRSYPTFKRNSAKVLEILYALPPQHIYNRNSGSAVQFTEPLSTPGQ